MTTRSDIEKTLWDGANTFRGKIDAANYKDYILSMLFIKYLSDKYDIYTVSNNGTFDEMKSQIDNIMGN